MVKISPTKEKPKNIMSIDASTNSLAFAIFSGNDLVTYGKIKFDGNNAYQKLGDAARKCLANICCCAVSVPASMPI